MEEPITNVSKTYFGFSRPNSCEVLGSIGCGFSSTDWSTCEGKFDGGFRLLVEGHQIGVHVDRAADVVREDVAERVVERVLDLGLQNFPSEFVRALPPGGWNR